ncbi:MAG: winged helix-turn-helix domain-containing protein [Anaerolineaceae bacterium]|nr:winged helix-turn-helix domain-containing protein [Anaerolineaceae bacterium]
MADYSENHRDLNILEKIEQNPDETQASLANQLGVAVGTINWQLKRLIAKGYVKVKRAERKKLRYIITPEGIALRARLTVDYIQSSFQLYRLVRQRVINALTELQGSGAKHVRLEGDGDVADICRLTCVERGVDIVKDEKAPLLKIQGLKIVIEDWKEEIKE